MHSPPGVKTFVLEEWNFGLTALWRAEASHLLTMEQPDAVNRLILDFLQHDPAPTMMPIRRAGPGGHAG